MTDEVKIAQFGADKPISEPSEDKLGRKPFVTCVAKSILACRNRDSVVVGINGKWGSGKTSLKDLILHEVRADLRPPTIVEFNPWLVSGEEAITQAFFAEIGGALEKNEDRGKEGRIENWSRYARMFKMGSKLAGAVEFAGLFVPGLSIAGGVAKTALANAGDLSSQTAESLKDLEVPLSIVKQELHEQFLALETPILVVIDDVDRLSKREIQLIIQLIKSNGDLPNLIYLILYQKKTVAEAIRHWVGGDGYEFLKKVVQIDLEVPKPPDPKKKAFFVDAIQEALEKIPLGRDFEKDRWSRLFRETVWPLLDTPRDIVRLKNNLIFYSSAHVVDGVLNVNPIDLILLELLRMNYPFAYDHIARAFVSDSDDVYSLYFSREEQIERFQKGLTHILEHGDLTTTNKVHVSNLIWALFPQTVEGFNHDQSTYAGWDRNLRLCHESHRPKYFELGIPENQISAGFLEKLLNGNPAPDDLGGPLKEVAKNSKKFDYLLEQIRVTRESIPVPTIQSLVTALLEISDGLPENKEARWKLFTVDPEYEIIHVIIVLLKGIRDKETRSETFRRSLLNTSAVTAPLLLLKELAEDSASPTDASRTGKLLDQTVLEQAQEALDERIKERVLDGSFLECRRARFLLVHFLLTAKTDEISPVRNRLRASPDLALRFLRALDSISVVSNSSKSQIIHGIYPEHLTRLFPKQEIPEFLPEDGSDEFDKFVLEKVRRWASGEEMAMVDERLYIVSEGEKGFFKDDPTDRF